MLKALIVAIAATLFFSCDSHAKKRVAISDVDDTLSESNIRHGGRIHSYILNGLRAHDYFVGMPFLFNTIYAAEADIHYVSGTLKFLRRLPKRFLEASGFPLGQLWVKPSWHIPTKDFKIGKIEEIMLSYPPDTEFILFGDNGEKDVEVYRYLQNHPVFGKQISHVFIHKLYPRPVGSQLAPNQIAYLTPAEIYLVLARDGVLSSENLHILLEQVLYSLRSQFYSVRRKALPYFASISNFELRKLQKLAQSFSDEKVQRLVTEIVAELRIRKIENETTIWGRCRSLLSKFF